MKIINYPRILLGLVMLLVLTSGKAQPALADLESSITECQSLEDDQPEQAISMASEWLAVISAQSDPVSYGRFLSCQGWAYAVMDQVDAAKTAALALERLATGLNQSKASVNLLRRAGSIFHRTGNRIGAADNYQAALEQAEQLKLDDEKIPLLVNLGVLNSEIREHERAINNYYAALELMELLDDFRYHAPVLYNLAVTLSGQKRFPEALDMYLLVEQQINDQWPKQRIGQVYFGMATAYGALRQWPRSADYANKTIEVLNLQDEDTLFAHSVKVYRALLEVRQGNNEGAEKIAEAAAGYYLRPDNEEALIMADNPLNTLSDLYEALGLTQKALDMNKAAQRFEQLFQDSFNKRVMAQMQARLSDIEQQNQLAELRNRNSQNELALAESAHNRTIMLLVAIALGLVLLVSWVWHIRSKKQLVQLSMLDTLTRMANRRGMMHWLDQQALPTPPGKRFLWLIDIDGFKNINDEHGHEAGDTTLVQVANSLAGLLNEQRFLARWGGEEFLLITQDVAEAGVGEFADRVLTQVRELHIRHGLQSFQVTVSMGVSVIKDDSAVMWSRALSQADKALFVAKDRGRDGMSRATDF